MHGEDRLRTRRNGQGHADRQNERVSSYLGVEISQILYLFNDLRDPHLHVDFFLHSKWSKISRGRKEKSGSWLGCMNAHTK